MYYVLSPFRVLWKLWFSLNFFGSFLLLYPLFRYLLAKEKRFRQAFMLKRVWGVFVRSLIGVILVKKKGAELPPPPYIICPNHSSYIDIILLFGVFKDYFIFMGKEEIKSWPLFRIFFVRNMNISVDRTSRVSAMRALVRASEELDKKRNVVIFPEGTIPKNTPNLGNFKNGAFKLAIEKQIPIVPITFIDNWKRLQTGAILKSGGGPGRARYYIHDYIDTRGMTEKDLVNLRKRVYAVIEKPLKEHESRR